MSPIFDQEPNRRYWAAFLRGQESPGTRALTWLEARDALVQWAPEPFVTDLWTCFRERG